MHIPGSDYLVVDDLHKHYGRVKAIDGMSLRIPRGEFLTLLGPSGSGKTTLLMAIAGFVKPNSGTIRLQGEDITALPPEKRDLGVVFQGYALFPHMTVTENVAFPLEVRKLPKPEIARLVAASLETVQLTGLADRKPAQLSGGQQQRVALARALVFAPPLILLDEPLSALDRQLRSQLQGELKQLHRKLGVSVVNVTHDQDEALSMSTLIAVINHGRIIQLGTPHEVYELPKTEFVAHFMGRSNLIEAEVVGRDAARNAVLKAGGHSFVSAHGAAAVVGSRVPVSLRPERMRLSGDSDGGDGAIPATLTDVTYHGNTTQLLVETALGVLRVEAQAGDSGFALEPGAKVSLSWPEGSPVVVERDTTA
ncbi:putative spermidine/putrescine transport system ATP-binding protein [Rhodoligotrophos appendicifer]|uniref:ABC transporter ATP-binding protein n=1 Tax=Rhodoligotrophos appendicifer TaxID=987056 RepID=UPI001186E238|nr:ABC transporter ATP-binding protein [Rhodoligotrophos appendicifer]